MGESMRSNHAFGAIRSVINALAVTIAAVAVALTASFTAGVQLLTSTLLVMGGNDNPVGLTPKMQQQLGGDPWFPAPNTDIFKPVGTMGHGYIDTENNPSSPFYGWDFTRVEWPADISLKQPYEAGQQQGVHNIDWAIFQTLHTLAAGEKAVALGYSSSANVIVREMRALQNQPGGAPATDQLEFFVMGSPNRPNGGVMQRFPGLYIPFVDIRLDGSTPVDTPYPTTDVSWQYDDVSDFPLYPINLLADINALFASSMLHGNYYPADMNGPRAFPDTTVGNITYITLKPPRIPLLLPLDYLGFPKALLDLVEPALTVMIEWGYDRSISPGTPTTARLIPRVNPITAAGDLAKAVVEGVRNFCDDIKPAAPQPATSRESLDAVVPQPRIERTVEATSNPRREHRRTSVKRESNPAAGMPRSAAADNPRRSGRRAA